ncbi:MAG: glycosyltransferase family 4 protein [Alphaproteobacteria bacterium]|nr:glycosyltransferase family 4 protein [Alphaproteobacteria bacterium]
MITGRKILYLFDQGDWKSRMPVAQAAKQRGCDVTIALIGAQDTNETVPGFETLHIKAPDGRMRGRDVPAMVRQIREILADTHADLVHTVTLKYAFITGLAALPFPDIRKIYTLAGLGYLFRSPDIKARLMRFLIGPLLRRVLRARGAYLIFQNPDDLVLMTKLRYAGHVNTALIRGSGVDLDSFTPIPEPEEDEPLVLMPTRLVKEKGVHIFVEAARLVKASGMKARFQIAGGETRHNPKAITKEEMHALTADGVIEWLGRVEDMPALLSQAAIIVYPSYYGEGIPRVLLEACAAGRAIITTDHAGCREAVEHNQNGLLVPIKNIKATADAIKDLLTAPDLRRIMGERSREKAEREFDINLVVNETLHVYEDALKD